MSHSNPSTHPTSWTPDALAKRVFIFTMLMFACVGTAFLLVSLAAQ